MIKTIKDLKYYRNRDWLRYNTTLSRYWLGFFLGEESSRCIRYQRILRNTEYCYNNRHKSPLHFLLYILWRVHLKRVSFRYKIYIGLNVCAPGLRIVHISGGVHINCKKVGENFTITSGCVVGKKGDNEHRAVIGNNVSLSLGTKVIGKVSIGDNVKTGPNTVVVKDIPKNVAVSGVPAVIINRYYE